MIYAHLIFVPCTLYLFSPQPRIFAYLGYCKNKCQDSLKALKEKQQRTVYRLTLVKGWNTEDIEAYSNLFDIGNPDFIEIKGVTYCGS